MSAPERIWVLRDNRGRVIDIFDKDMTEPFEGRDDVEYIRADAILSDPRVKALVDALEKVVAADNARNHYHKLPNERLPIGSRKSTKSRAKTAWLKAFRRSADASHAALAALKGGQDAEDQ